MSKDTKPKPDSKKKSGNIFEILREYKKFILFLILLGITSNVLTLIIPKLISKGIDSYNNHTLIFKSLIIEFGMVIIGIFIFTFFQTIVQTIVSEKVAYNFREKLAKKISRQDYEFLKVVNPNKLLTNLTSDIDSLKMFVSQAIVQSVSSIVIIIGASILLISIDLKLGLFVFLMIPVIIIVFIFIFKKAKMLFTKIRTIID